MEARVQAHQTNTPPTPTPPLASDVAANEESLQNDVDPNDVAANEESPQNEVIIL